MILLTVRLDDTMAAGVHREGYNWTLTVTPENIKDFQDGTLLLKRFERARTDESFDVYLLK